MCINGECVTEAYSYMVQHGATTVLSPTQLIDSNGRGTAMVAEVQLYGDVVLRLLDSGNFTGSFLPNYQDVTRRNSAVDTAINILTSCVSSPTRGHIGRYGIERIDHVVGNVVDLQHSIQRIKNMTVSVASRSGCIIIMPKF